MDESRIFGPIVVLSILLATVLATSCTGERSPTPVDSGNGMFDSGEGDDASDASTISPCEPPLEIHPSTASVSPLGLLTLTSSGGTDQPRFELVENESGAIVNELSGAYLAGTRSGSSDRVRVRDVGCFGEAFATIDVVPELVVRPTTVEAPPGTAFVFEVTGGSGRVVFTLVQDGSGGTVTSSGAYLAGPGEGRDWIRVTDLGTFEEIEATIDVAKDASLVASPSALFLGLHQQQQLHMEGGSGEVVLETSALFVRLEDSILTGLSPGGERITLRDRFTSQTAPLDVQVIAPLEFTPVRGGDSLFGTSFLAAGDLNGDGRPDAIVAHPEADIAANAGGAVYVYTATAAGLARAPVQILSGANRDDLFGSDVALADFDGDGRADLVVGTPNAEAGGPDVGRVEVYYGLIEGGFETPARQTVEGRFAGDLFGSSVAACDFDGDGDVDLAVGAVASEDRARSARANDQGGVFIFLQDAGVLPNTPDVSLWGDVPSDTGGFTGVAGLRFGTDLAAIDFDDDGACDLAVGAATGAGAVFIFKGADGGPLPEPSLGWSNQDPEDLRGAFGRRLAAGDLDGDGLPELAVSHHAHKDGARDQVGAVHVYRGRALPVDPITALAPAEPADFSVEGTEAFDQIGWHPAIHDTNADGLADLIIGNPGDEAAEGATSAGTVQIFFGRTSTMPASIPSRVYAGDAAYDRLGGAVDVLGDVDGDGAAELLAFAQHADAYGRDFGVPYLLFGERGRVALELPGEASGMRFGQSGDIVGDLDGDGFEDLVVGAPYAAADALGLRTGAAYIYRGTASGFERAPAVELTSFDRLSGSDLAAWTISRAGDFDGDGRADFALLAYREDLAGAFGATYAVGPDCSPARYDVGAVFVFRGGAGVLPKEPSFIYFGPAAGQGLRSVAGAVDVDADGFDDLIVGIPDLDRADASDSGGVALIRGRAIDPGGRITVICAPDFLIRGSNGGDQLGRAVAALGDLDGDGCGEFAAGAPFEDLGSANQGTVRVFHGWGGPLCPPNPQMTVFVSGFVGSQGGFALASGDIDSDGIRDLAVGLPALIHNGDSTGGAALLLGDDLAARPREPAQDATPPVTTEQILAPTGPNAIVFGRRAGEGFGRAVAVLPGALIAGSPNGDIAGVELSGGARAFAFAPVTGLTREPTASFGGESERVGGLLGDLLSAGRLGGRSVVLVGGYYGSGVGLDTGSAYVLDFGP